VSVRPPRARAARPGPVESRAIGQDEGVKTLGNILWLVLAGIWLAIGYTVAGLLMCITIIGIPFGIQAFKLAGFVL